MKKPQEIITPGQIIEIAWRRRWLIIVSFTIAMLVGIYLSTTLPRIYQAETMILVERQRVPTDYVRSVVSTDLNARISTIRQQILSRSNLEKIIEQFNLFTGPEQQKIFLEDKTENLRRRIQVDVITTRIETGRS